MPPKRASTPSSRKRVRRVDGEDVVEDSDYFTDEEEERKASRKRARSLDPGAKTQRSPGKATTSKGSRSRSATPSNGLSMISNKRKQVVLLNNLPLPPLPRENPTHVLVFGNGELGTLGMGLEKLENMPFPRFQTGKSENSPYSGQVEAVACGSHHTLTLCDDNTVRSFGINDNGPLGRATTSQEYTSEELETRPLPMENLADFRPSRISCGDSFSVMLSADGDMRYTGAFRSSAGLLAQHQTPLIEYRPRRPYDLPDIAFTQIATGADHVVALDVYGSVWTFGNGQQGQLGRKVFERRKENGLKPQKLGLKKIKAVGSGQYTSFAVDHKGLVHAWGFNAYRQCGLLEEDGGYLEIVVMPTLVQALTPSKHAGAKVVQISGGESHTLFLFDNGKVFGCGRCDGHEVGLAVDHSAVLQALRKEAPLSPVGKSSEEGNAPVLFIPTPTEIQFPEEESQFPFITEIISKNRQNLSICKTGKVYSFGYSQDSALGLGDKQLAETPTILKSQDMTGLRCVGAGLGAKHGILLMTAL